MGLFGLFGKKRLNHDLTDEEREMGQAERRRKHEIRQLEHDIQIANKQLELAEVRAALDEYEDNDEGDGVDQMVLNVVKEKLLGGLGSAANKPTAITPTLALTNEAIEELLSKLPASYLKIARGMSDDALQSVLRSRTQYDEETCRRIIAKFREKNL